MKVLRNFLIMFTFILMVLIMNPVKAQAYETAWFPAPQMWLTQVAYEVGNGASHANYNAIDIAPGGRVFAPFTGYVKQVDWRWGYVLFQSEDKVYYADGTLDYMTVGFMHDEDISNITKNQRITQGTNFYDAGGQGKISEGVYGHVKDYGYHVDISIFRGKVDSVSSYGNGNVYAYDAFCLNTTKTPTTPNRGAVEPGHTTNNGAPTDWTNLWRTSPEPQDTSPNGHLDVVRASMNAVAVGGWASDIDAPDQAVKIHVYIGDEIHELTADVNRSEDVGKHGFAKTIRTKNTGQQTVRVYALNIGPSGNARNVLLGQESVFIEADTVAPTISNVQVVGDYNGYTISCDVSDDYGIEKVQFPTWTDLNGQDDKINDWRTSSVCSGTLSNGTATFRVNRSDHNDETGLYWTHIYAFDIHGNETMYKLSYTFESESPVISDVKVEKDANGYTVYCKAVDESGIKSVRFPTWTTYGGQDDLPQPWRTVNETLGTARENGNYSYRVNLSDHNKETGLYMTHIYAFDSYGNNAHVKVAVRMDEDFEPVATRSYNGHTYYLCRNASDESWNDIKTYCDTMGGYLATVSSAGENSELQKMLQSAGIRSAFIGADRNNEDIWKWITGEPWSYENWDANEPNNDKTYEGGQRYLRIMSDGSWDDTWNDASLMASLEGFIIEVDNVSSYPITYHLDGGINDSDNPDTYRAGAESLSLKDPVKNHYIFKGWYTKETGGTEFTSTTKPEGNLELYARWEAVGYKLTLDVNGGEKLDPSTMTLTFESVNVTLPTPRRVDHTFIGWYDAKENGSKITAVNRMTADMTLYAYWKPDCDINGHKGGTANCVDKKICLKCGQEYGETDPSNHTGNTEMRGQKEATCEEAGYTGDTYCKDCGTKISNGTAIAKKEHQWNAGIITTAAGCSTKGVKTYTCTQCNGTKTEEIPAKGHGETEIRNRKDAQIGVAGYTGDIYCKDCGALLERGRATDPLTADHTHSYTPAVTKAAKCTEKGIRTFTCSCGESYTEEIPATGHRTIILKFEKAASCKAEGYSGDRYCDDCGIMVEEGRVTAKRSHTWNNGVVTAVATCTETGRKTYSCTVCGETKNETISATGHGTAVVKNARAATCTAEGYSGDRYCSVCNVKTETGKTVAKKTHSWDGGKVTTPATQNAFGIRTFTCNVCKTTKTESIDKLPVTVTLPTDAPASNPVSQDKSGMIGQDAEKLDTTITATKADEIKGSVYQLLRLKCKTIAKTSLTIQWSRVTGATGYIVYGAKCGSKFVKLGMTDKMTFKQSGLKAGTYYKYFVVAEKNGVAMATSKTIHLATSGGKVGNTKSIKLNKTKVTIKVKKSFTIKVKTTPYSKKLKVKNHRGTAYESSNPSIATVSTKGKIVAKKKGSCYVYAYAQDGVYAKIKVTVK